MTCYVLYDIANFIKVCHSVWRGYAVQIARLILIRGVGYARPRWANQVQACD